MGTTASGLFLAGGGGRVSSAIAHVAEAHDYVADPASACMLTAEQEEGPFYVDLEQVRHDIVGGEAGLPLELEITIINSLTCKPLRHAAVDVWHCNASGVYSDISSENTIGKTYLRGVQLTDRHGRASFKTIFPGHYSGRTTHIHARIHINAEDRDSKLAGGHVAHTGQMFPPDAVYTEVYQLAPYNAETATIVDHAQDRVWTQQHGSEAQLRIRKLGNRLTKGLVASVALAVNPRATPALIGATSTGGAAPTGASGPSGSSGPTGGTGATGATP